MFNEDNITLFNSYVVDRVTKYVKTYLYGVDWQEKQSMSINQVRGIMNADSISIFIDCDVNSNGKKYITPRAFLQLPDSEKENYYTFRANDKIVKGIVDFDINETNTIKQLETNYDGVVDIKTVISCNMMEYFELGCE